MRPFNSRWLRIALVWTLLTLAVAVVLAVQAAASLDAGQQACFFSYPAVPCPSIDDPAVTRLTFAFFGVPAIWLIGIGVMTLVWARRRRRGPTTPGDAAPD